MMMKKQAGASSPACGLKGQRPFRGDVQVRIVAVELRRPLLVDGDEDECELGP